MKRKEPEREIQTTIVKALRDYNDALPDHKRVAFWHVPNGGKRHIRTATKLKADGVLPGVADLHFCLPGGKLACLELKSKKGQLSPEQKAFRDTITALQGWWGVAHSIDEAMGILAAWGCLPSECGRGRSDMSSGRKSKASLIAAG